MRRLAYTLLWCAAVGNLSCDSTSNIELPDPSPQADLAFAVLYEDGAPSVVGDIVLRQAVYSGRYGLRGAKGLDARLFFINADDLRDAGQGICDALSSAVDRVLCTERIEACADGPSCWRAVASSEGCGDGISLGEQVPLQTYVSSDGQLSLQSGSGADGVSLCGPALASGCANRRAGYVATEAGRFQCVAEVRQIDCDVTIRAPDCGLSEITVTVNEAGGVTQLSGSGCEVADMSSASNLGVPAEFALNCGEKTLSFHPQQALLGTAECARRGPGTFETDAPTSGRVFDARSMRLGTAPPQLVMAGTGRDGCADYGCRVRGEVCNPACDEACSGLLILEGCTRDSWEACAPETEKQACLTRCQSFCARPEDASCFPEVAGLALTLSRPETPEADLLRINEDSEGNSAPLGWPTLADLGEGWIANLTQARVRWYVASQAAELLPRGEANTGMQAAGLAYLGTDRLAWFGSLGGQGLVRTGVLARGPSAAFTPDAPDISVTGLPSPDRGVLAGSRGDWLFLATVTAEITSVPRHEVHIVDIDSRAELPAVVLPGPVTALASLPQGLVIAAYEQTNGPAGIAIMEPGSGRVDQVHTIELLQGLKVKAMTLDGRSCDRELPSNCTIFLGLESTTAGSPALLGALQYDAAMPQATRMTSNLRASGTQTVDQIVMDVDLEKVWLVASQRNVLTPFLLTE